MKEDDNMRLTTRPDATKELKSPAGMRKTEDLPEFPIIEIRSPKVKRVLQVAEQCNIVVKSAKLRLSVLITNALRDAAVRRSLTLVVPALFPRRLDVTELVTLILSGNRIAPNNESNSPVETMGTEDLPRFRNIEICSPTVKRVLWVAEQRNIVVKSAKLRLSVLITNSLPDAAVRRSLNLVMPALFPRRLDVTELVTLILGGDRTTSKISESNSPAGTAGTEDIPQSLKSCVETMPADLQRPSTVTHIFIPKVKLSNLSPIRGRLQEYVQEQLLESSCVELETFDDDISPDGTADVVSDGLRAPTAVVEVMSAAADHPQSVRRRSLISAVGRQLLKVSRILCCWCGKK